MNELEFILQFQADLEKALSQMKELGTFVRKELNQEIETTVKVNVDDKQVGDFGKLLNAALDKFEKSEKEMTEGFKKINSEAKGAAKAMRPSQDTERAMSRYRSQLADLLRDIENLRKLAQNKGVSLNNIIGTGAPGDLQRELSRIGNVGQQLGLTDLPRVMNQTKFALAEMVSQIRGVVTEEELHEAAIRATDKAQETRARKVQQRLDREKKKTGEVVEQQERLTEAQRESQRIAATSTTTTAAEASPSSRFIPPPARSAGVNLPGSGGNDPFGLSSALISTFRSQSALFREPQTATLDELTSILKEVAKEFGRLEKLEGELSRSTSEGEIERLLGAVERQQVKIQAQEDRFARRALAGAPAINAPRVDESGLILKRDADGNIISRAVKQDVARRELRTYFETVLGDAFKTATRRARDEAAKLRKEGREDEARELEAVNNADLLKAVFEPEQSKQAERMAQAMRDTGRSAEIFARENREAYEASKQIETTLLRQRSLSDAIGLIEKNRAERARRIAGYYRAVRGLSYTIGGFAVGISAGQQIREAFGSSFQLEQELAGIQAVLPRRSSADADILRGAIVDTASKYGADLAETAQAARLLAQTGLDAQDVMEELNVTMLGMRGADLTIEQMQELQIAIRAVAGEAATLGQTEQVLDKISKVEAQFAVVGKDLADAIRLAAPVVNQFAGDLTGLQDAIDITIGLSTEMVEQLRITGNQAGNALKFILARLARPEVLQKLQDVFGVRLASQESGGDRLLPLNDILAELVGTFDELDQAQQQQFAVLLAGGRRVNAALTFLQNYNEVVEISRRSATAFGDVGERTAIQLDTFSSSVQILGTNFGILVDNLNRGTGLAAGLRNIVDLTSKLTQLASGPGGPLLASVLGIGGAAAGVGLAKTVYGEVELTRAVSLTRRAGYDVSREALAQGIRRTSLERLIGGEAAGALAAQNGGVLPTPGRLGRFAQGAKGLVTNPFVVVSGAILALTAFSGVIREVTDAMKRDERYLVQRRSLSELGFFESQQFARLRDTATEANFATPQAAVAAMAALVQSPEFQGAAGEGGVAGLLGRVQTLDRAQVLRGGFISRGDLANEIIAGLPEATQEVFNGMKFQAERTALATRLVAQSALVFNASIRDMVVNVEEASKTLKADFAENLRTGPNTLGAIIANIFRSGGTGSVDFDRILPSRAVVPATYDPNVYRGTFRTGNVPGSIDILLGEFQSLFGPLSGNLFSGESGIALQDRLRDSFLALEGTILDGRTTVEEAFNLFLDSIEGTQAEADLIANVRRSAREVIVGDLLESNPSLDAATLLGTGGQATAQDRVTKLFTEAIEAEILSIQETLKTASAPAKALEDLNELLQYLQDPSVAVNIAEAAKGLEGLRNRIIEFLVSMSQQIERLRIDSQVASDFGREFDYFSRGADLFANLLGDFRGLRAEVEGGIIKDIAQLASLRGATFEGNTLTPEVRERLNELLQGMDEAEIVEALGVSAEELKRKIDDGLASIERFYVELESLGEFLPDDPLIASAMERAFGDIDWRALTADEIEAQLRNAGITLEDARLEFSRGLEERILATESATTNLEIRRGQLSSLRDPLQAFAENIRIQSQVDRQSFLAERTNRLTGGLSNEELQELEFIQKRQAENLRKLTLEFNSQLQQDLVKQVTSNVESAVSGVRKVLSDTSIWADIGSGAEDSFRNLFAAIFDPIAQTFSDRVATNITESLVDNLLNQSLVTRLFESPETRMQNAIIAGGAFASSSMYQAIVQGTLDGQNAAKAAEIDGLDLSGASVQQANNDALIEQLKFAGAIVGGSVLGGAVARSQGRDNRFAGTGATIGAVAGSFLPIPGGQFIGGALGGALGGLLGGKSKEEEQANRQIRVLEAIERAQVATIQTIENQTGELLSPTNRLINLPTSFSVPEFNPGGAISVSFDFSGTVIASDIDIDNLTNRVQTAVVDGLAEGRRTGSRSFRRF